MSEKISYENLIEILDPKKTGDHAWFLSLLDDEAQKSYENEHLDAVMRMLCYLRIRPHKNAIKAAQEEIRGLEKDGNTAENYVKIRNLLAEMEEEGNKIQSFRPQLNQWFFLLLYRQ